jgi:hypothetical protein
MRAFLVLIICLMASVSRLGFGKTQFLLEATVDSASFYESADTYSKVLGVFPIGSVIEIEPGFENFPGQFFKAVATSTTTQKKITGFVLKSEFREFRKAQKATSSKKESPQEKPFYPWSLGVGLSGTSDTENTSVVIASELRYLWNLWLESYFGIDLSLGTATAVGSRVGQRFYFPDNQFRPYIQGGYQIRDFTAFNSSAFELGLGLQVVRRNIAYFELGGIYLIRNSFDSTANNYWVFGGSSGLRF